VKPSFADDLRQRTASALDPHGLRRDALPAEWAMRESANGRTRLTAERWTLADGSEARLVFIRGAASEIVNAMLYPPSDGPVLVAEFLSAGHQPRIVFVDVQTPGLDDDGRRACRESIPPGACGAARTAPIARQRRGRRTNATCMPG
jgi:hypothetical protein